MGLYTLIFFCTQARIRELLLKFWVEFRILISFLRSRSVYSCFTHIAFILSRRVHIQILIHRDISSSHVKPICAQYILLVKTWSAWAKVVWTVVLASAETYVVAQHIFEIFIQESLSFTVLLILTFATILGFDLCHGLLETQHFWIQVFGAVVAKIDGIAEIGFAYQVKLGLLMHSTRKHG